MSNNFVAAMKCPTCGRSPDVDRCDPWDSQEWGPVPFYAVCADNDHCMSANGDTLRGTVEAWNHEVSLKTAERNND